MTDALPEDAPALERPSPLLERVLHPGERLLWSGRPRTGLAPGDGEAALIGTILVFSALGTASILFGWEHQIGTARAGLAACVFGLAVAFGRATTSGATLTLGLALQAPMLALAAAKLASASGLEALSGLICPASSLLFLLAWAGRRFLGHRGLRYHLSRERGFVERPGRFVVAFEFEGPPEIVPSRLSRGLVGTARFLTTEGRLTTPAGGIWKVPAPQCRFVRVEAPWEIAEAWARE